MAGAGKAPRQLPSEVRWLRPQAAGDLQGINLQTGEGAAPSGLQIPRAGSFRPTPGKVPDRRVNAREAAEIAVVAITSPQQTKGLRVETDSQ